MCVAAVKVFSGPSAREERPKLSVIVLNWNAPADTIRCLRSFAQLRYPNYALVVVDNCSTDDSIRRIRESIPDIDIVETERNLGYAGGNNRGIEHALLSGSEFVLIINNDTEVLVPNFLDVMVDEMERDGSVGIVGPKVINPGGGIQDTMLPAPIFVNSMRASLDRLTGSSNARNYSIEQDVDAISGVCWLIRSKVIAQIGLLDEDYFMYVEEQEYCYRARRQGWRVLYTPVESIIHYRETDNKNKERSVRKFILVRRNLVLFSRKEFGLLRAAGLGACFLVSNGLRVICGKIMRRDGEVYSARVLLALLKEIWYVLVYSRKRG